MVAAAPVTFTLIAQVYYNLWAISAGLAGSPAACGALCGQHQLCGGFVFDTNDFPACLLVVDKYVVGSVPYVGRAAYRMNAYRGGLFELLELNAGKESWFSSHETCMNVGMNLVPYPASIRDRAVLSIRTHVWLYVDVHRDMDGNFVSLRDLSVVPDSVVESSWGLGQPSEMGAACLMLLYDSLDYYDVNCFFPFEVPMMCALTV